MNTQAALSKARDFYNHNMRVRNPKRVATRQLQEIHSELESIMRDNFVSSNDKLRGIYNLMCENRIDKLFSNLSYADSMDETEAEMEALGLIPDIEMDNTGIPKPFMQATTPIAEMTTTTEYQHLLLHTLAFIYDFLQGQSMDYALKQKLTEVYMTLNDESLYHSAKKFENFYKTTENEMTKNMLGLMRSVLNGFQRDKAKLQTKLQEAKRIGKDNAESSVRYKLVLQDLTPEDLTFYKEISLGSTSTFSRAPNSFVCGECEQLNYNDVPIIRINSKVFMTRMSPQDIMGNIYFEICKCEHCGKYNILPSYMMESFAALLTDRSDSIGAQSKSSKDVLQITTVGKGLIDAVLAYMTTAIEDQTLDEIKTQMIDDLDNVPIVNTVDYMAISSFPELKSSKVQDIVYSTVAEMDGLREGRRILIQEDESTEPKTESDGDSEQQQQGRVMSEIVGETDAFGTTAAFNTTNLDAETIADLRRVYSDRVTINSDGTIKLDVGPQTMGFAKLFISQSVSYGYSHEDLIKSVCSPDTSYYNKLVEYRDLILLNTGVRKLRLMLENIGYNFDTGYFVSLDKLKNFYAELVALPATLYTILPAECNPIQNPWQGLDLTPIEKIYDESQLQQIEKQMLSEAESLNRQGYVYSRLIAHIKEYVEQLRGSNFCYPRIGQTVGTLTLLVYCELAAPRIESKIITMEDTILELIKWEADYPTTVIDLGNYNYPAASPIHVMSERLTTAIIDSVYYKMLKNTISYMNLDGYFNLYIKDSIRDPFSLYHAEIRRIKSVLQQMRVEDITRRIFCSNFNRLYDYYISGATQTKSEYIYLMENADIDKLNYRIPPEFAGMHSDKFHLFIAELLCDTVNVLTSTKVFTDITYIQEDVLDLHINTKKLTLKQKDKLASLVYCMPDTSKQVKEDTLAYLIKNLVFDSYDVLSPDDSVSDLWNDDTEADDEVNQYRIDILSGLLTVFRPEMTEDTIEMITSDISRYEQEV